ncbi:MAG TPA: hypothetical protein VN048_08515 [Verrucomicrobiae bacterium]|jgi:hypothetical protein|nr:hypothetical protein [Verrucomicrobiae bacterium]
MTIETLVNYGILAGAGYGLTRWIKSGENTPDPWGPEIDQRIRDLQTPALCHRCLIPQEHDAWFCPECGSAVGPYNNYMPFVVVFSQGEVLRAGVNDRFRPSFLIVCGFVVYALTQYAVFAPIYWYFMYQNFRRNFGDAGSENVQET